jgi:hypothetical protein
VYLSFLISVYGGGVKLIIGKELLVVASCPERAEGAPGIGDTPTPRTGISS